jgi:hypothetical protein
MCSFWPAQAADLRFSWFPLTREGRSSGIRPAQGPQAAEPGEAGAYDTLTRSAGTVRRSAADDHRTAASDAGRIPASGAPS